MGLGSHKLAMGTQSTPATCEEAPPTLAWRLDEKPRQLQVETAQPQRGQKQLDSRNARRLETRRGAAFASRHHYLGRCARIWQRAPRAAAYTAKRQLLAEGVAAAMRRRRARTSHMVRGHRASEPHTNHGRRRTNNQTSPTAFNRLTPRNARALFHQKQGNHVDDSTVAPRTTPRAGVPRYSLRSSATTRTTVIRAAGSV